MLTQQEFDDESPVPELKSAKATGVENATATYRQALQQPLDKPPVTRE